MKQLRRLHLYLGVFFTPLLLFFISTGWYQTVNQDRLKSPGEAESIAQHLRAVHTDHVYPTNHEFRRPTSPRPFKILVVVMSIALIVTTLLGLILAFRFTPSKLPVALSLIAGILVPVLVLWLAQQR